MTILRTNSDAYLSQPKLVPKVNFRGDFCFFLTTDHRYALASPRWSFWGSWATGNQKVENVGEPKIVGVEYHSASNLRTHRDKCFVGWNCAFFTLRQNGRQVFPPTFRDEQETLDAIPFIFCHLSANWYLSETLHTPGPVNSIISICR